MAKPPIFCPRQSATSASSDKFYLATTSSTSLNVYWVTSVTWPEPEPEPEEGEEAVVPVPNPRWEAFNGVSRAVAGFSSRANNDIQLIRETFIPPAGSGATSRPMSSGTTARSSNSDLGSLAVFTTKLAAIAASANILNAGGLPIPDITTSEDPDGAVLLSTVDISGAERAIAENGGTWSFYVLTPQEYAEYKVEQATACETLHLKEVTISDTLSWTDVVTCTLVI